MIDRFKYRRYVSVHPAVFPIIVSGGRLISQVVFVKKCHWNNDQDGYLCLYFFLWIMIKDTSFFDSRAGKWEETFYPPAVREKLIHLVANFGVQPNEVILDVGTGSGILLPYLSHHLGTSGRIAALDLSFEMVKHAKSKHIAIPHLILRSDVHYLPFASDRFDKVICFAAFPHFHDAGIALKEMARVTRIHGTIIISHLMSRQELAKHHAAQGAVAKDRLPNDDAMALLFQAANLKLSYIIDKPGRYMASGIKQ